MKSCFLLHSAVICEKPVPMPPIGGKVVLMRPGITFGGCFHDFKNRKLPSCPNLKISKKDSIWDIGRNGRVVHIYWFELTTTNDESHIDNAFLNLSFSAQNDLKIPSNSKVILK